jgi:hypothetical protein
MPNPKRNNKIKHWKYITEKSRASKRQPSWQYATLSDIEDRNVQSFLTTIASNAAINAINENKAMNIPLTLMEDGWVVQKTSEGKVLKVARIDQKMGRSTILTKGAILHVKSNQ